MIRQGYMLKKSLFQILLTLLGFEKKIEEEYAIIFAIAIYVEPYLVEILFGLACGTVKANIEPL